MGEPVPDTDGVSVGLAGADSVLAAGDVLSVEGLDDAGDDAGVAVAVTVTRAVSVAVAVVVVVAVPAGGALIEALDAPVGEADGADVGPAVAPIDGAVDGAGDRNGMAGPLTEGRLTASLLVLRLGVEGVKDGAGRPLAPTVAETDGTAEVRLGVPEPSPACPQAARTSPTTLTTTTTRTRIIPRPSHQRNDANLPGYHGRLPPECRHHLNQVRSSPLRAHVLI